MAIKSFKRYEKKYLLTGEQYEKLIPRLLEYMKMDDHCVNNSYSIYNIYYDTDDNSVIRHSISKPYYKEKLRLRSYKIPQSPSDKVFLELKKKINKIVNKRRAIITLEEAYNFLEFGERPKCTDFITEQVINEIEYYLSHTKVNPTIYIGYNRIAFFGKEDKDFRLTIDSKIITRREDLFLESGCHGTDILKPNGYAVIFTIILCAVMIILDSLNFAMPKSKAMVLKITVPEDLNFEGVFDEILNTNTTSWNMVKVRTRDFGALYELNYSIHLKNDVNQKKFIDSLRVRNGNLNISLTSCGSEDKIFN
ncbi:MULTISPECIES: polyphosphate polymerase domain-containing protein [Clostridia]|uniref:Polyphosphate polymerase domain-containing protein n=2 Tax=Clostridia TaxID=186801 RepID=A0A8I0A6M6_9CLOT|nr:MULTISPECIES: polyphosphate polymerase domain-containing protein [Clostridia]MBC5639137.1 polyphosphate polymerase domain-containing protein [Clostridium lentum]MBC5653230.1 polyphosphate polymerase domain-containing protein [Blautia lenta]CDB76204.1 vTC domain [Clostridium sp. CAG:265]